MSTTFLGSRQLIELEKFCEKRMGGMMLNPAKQDPFYLERGCRTVIDLARLASRERDAAQKDNERMCREVELLHPIVDAARTLLALFHRARQSGQSADLAAEMQMLSNRIQRWNEQRSTKTPALAIVDEALDSESRDPDGFNPRRFSCELTPKELDELIGPDESAPLPPARKPEPPKAQPPVPSRKVGALTCIQCGKVIREKYLREPIKGGQDLVFCSFACHTLSRSNPKIKRAQGKPFRPRETPWFK